VRDWVADLHEWWGALAIVAAGLLFLLAALLPSGKRSLARRPAVFFALYLAIVALGAVVPEARWVRVVALATVLMAVFRSALLLATETGPGRWLFPQVPRIFVDVVQGLLYGVVALFTLHAAGLEPGELLTTSALLTAVIGLALQDTLGNLFSGLAIQIGQPFEVGDWIELDGQAGHHGRVLEIGWRSTTLRTLDDNEVIVPNGVIAKSLVRNHSRPTSVERRHVRFGASYDAPPERVRAVVLEAVAGTPKVLETPAPSVVTTEYGDSAVVYDLRYHTDDHQGGHVTDGRVRDRVWYALRRAGIPIPFPQRDVHLFTHDVERERRDRQVVDALRDRALGYVALFDVLTPEQHRALASASEDRLYGDGEEIVRQGEAGNELFVVVEGEVEVLAGDPPSRITALGPGKFFGEMSLLTGAPRNATVRAIGGCRLVSVGHAALKGVFHEHPELFERMGMVLAERTMQLDAHVAARANDDTTEEERAARAGRLLERIRAFFPVP
jgi:small-conductance mechanosensitive channel/CRP-like cAMP-binding protein